MGLVIAVLLTRDLVALPFGTVGTDLFQGEQVGARLHDTSRQEESRHVDAGYGHEVGRHGFIATGDEETAIEGGGADMDLHQGGHDVARYQGIVHAVVSLCFAIANVGTEIVGRMALCLSDPFAGNLHQLQEVGTAGMAMAVAALHDDLCAVEVGGCPTTAQSEGVDFRGSLSEFLTVHTCYKSFSI